MKSIVIIGGGASALMLAAQLDPKKFDVTLCDQKKSVGRKFLVAGVGGLNLTYDCPIDQLISHYEPSAFMDPILRQFTNEATVSWMNGLGVATFTGSSNRVFPTEDLKPIEVLNKIVDHAEAKEVDFQMETKWEGWNEEGLLTFEEFEDVEFDLVVFALGGASWTVTGSDGKWASAFADRGIVVHPFRAANCAFSVEWNKNFISTHVGKPLKNIAMTFDQHRSKGELVITKFGLEGNALYALSEKIQQALLTKKSVAVHLDLKPTMTVDQIIAKYKSSELEKTTDILKEDLNLERSAIGILKQFTDKETFLNPELLAAALKSVPILFHSADDIDKAISTLGGISLDEVDSNFQLKKIPNTYAIGEMLDWYAPTGGYLLQGCFSMGYALAEHLNKINKPSIGTTEEE